MERRFGVMEPNITPWRRAVAGDLTAVFDFSKQSSTKPRLPSTTAYKPIGEPPYADYAPTPPKRGQLPRQEPRIRPSRALPYRFDVDASVQPKRLSLQLANPGPVGVALHVRSNQAGATMAPECYTVGANSSTTADVALSGAYDVSVHGPNGYFRQYADGTDQTDVTVHSTAEKNGTLVLSFANTGTRTLTLSIVDAYTGPRVVTLRRGGTSVVQLGTHTAAGWYDLTVTSHDSKTFVRRLAGRIETGAPSISDPQLGNPSY